MESSRGYQHLRVANGEASVIYSQQHLCGGYSERYNRVAAIVTGVLQLMCGVALAVLAGTQFKYQSFSTKISYGIWAGVLVSVNIFFNNCI